MKKELVAHHCPPGGQYDFLSADLTCVHLPYYKTVVRRRRKFAATEQGPGVSVEAISIPSDPQRRKPDEDQTCCDGVVIPSTGDGWPI